MSAGSPPPAPAGAASRPGLIRAIGRWDLTALVVNGVIGSSIFGMPSVLAGLTGAWSPVTSMGANLNVFVDYLAQLAPATGAARGRAAVMCAVTAAVTALNVIGV